jgi:hypothetical protein
MKGKTPTPRQRVLDRLAALSGTATVAGQHNREPNAEPRIRGLAGDKPMAIGECARLPRPAELDAQPRWVFFMAWAELVYESNSEAEIVELHQTDRVVTLDELDGW